MEPLSEITLSLSACLAFRSATGPDRPGDGALLWGVGLAKLMPRALAEDERGEAGLPLVKFEEVGNCKFTGGGSRVVRKVLVVVWDTGDIRGTFGLKININSVN